MNKNQMKSELIDKFIDTNNLNNKIFTNKNNKSEFINVINIIKDENIDFNKLIAIYNTSDNKRVLFFEEYFVLFFENKLDKVITYKELQNLEKDKNMIVITLNSTTLKLTDDDNINSLYYFLYFILYIYSQINMELISEEDNNEIISKIGGISIGEFQTINKLFDEERFSSRQGHGFAAERANNLFDRLTGKDAKIVGDDNSKNGADRIVNGVEIQSKYCATGSRCVNECFSENGKGEFRYYNKTGQPMKIEVPSDKYEAAVKAMEEKIRRGQVKGVTDPEDAKNIIKKGNFTYEQAKNIAKAGTVESIIYDSINGVIIASSAFGISATISFAYAIWNDEDYDTALKSAACSGFKVGGVTFLSTVISSQLAKAGLNSALVGGSEAFVNILGPKASSLLINAFRIGKQPIYGAAAAKSAAKLLRGNIITSTVTIAVLSSMDVKDIFCGKISGTQLFKNLASTASSVAGGTGGWLAGASVGTAILPGVGTVIGGLIGSLVGGSVANKTANVVLGSFIEDDAVEMVRIIQKEFENLAKNYLLTKNEVEEVTDKLSYKLDGGTLKDMFASEDRRTYANNLLLPLFEDVILYRKEIILPTEEEMSKGIKLLLEDLNEQIENQNLSLA